MTTHNGGSKVVGGAKKVVTFVLTAFALLVAVQMVGPLMNAAAALVDVLTHVINAITQVAQQISEAMNAAAGSGR